MGRITWHLRPLQLGEADFPASPSSDPWAAFSVQTRSTDITYIGQFQKLSKWLRTFNLILASSANRPRRKSRKYCFVFITLLGNLYSMSIFSYLKPQGCAVTSRKYLYLHHLHAQKPFVEFPSKDTTNPLREQQAEVPPLCFSDWTELFKRPINLNLMQSYCLIIRQLIRPSSTSRVHL